MTYKNCIHYEVCNAECGELLSRINQGCEQCKHFKDKSLIVELPCKVKDKVYYISIKRYVPLTHKIVEAEVLDYVINGYGICSAKIRPLNSERAFIVSINKIYFTKLEADARLKELNNETI